jgi:hypothetical protein
MHDHRATSCRIVIAASCLAGALYGCASDPDPSKLTRESPPSTEAERAPPATSDARGTPMRDSPALPDAVRAEDAEPGFSLSAIKVCPAGCDYTLPSQAVAAATDGALIEILAGSYEDCVAIRLDRVTLRGIKGFAHLHGKQCDGKGIIVTYGQGIRLERLELSDFANTEYNGAGIRHDAVAKDLAVSNLFLHDGQLGILASSTGDAVSIDSTVFQRVGVARPDGEISVPLYVTGAKTLSIRRSRFLHGVGGASMIKSRALSTSIACSVIANLDGPDSYSVDLQLGNDFSLVNSVIEQSVNTQNNTIIGYGSSSFDAASATSFTITGTTFINDASGGTFINLFRGAPAKVDVSGNTFVGSGTALAGATLGDNQRLATRPETLGAYPSLPDPGACP